MTITFQQRTTILAGVIVLLGILVALTPWFIFPVCEVKGISSHASMQMPHEGSMDHSGSEILMRCGYTARAETIIGVLLAITGLVAIAHRKGKYRKLAGSAVVVLGILAALVPTILIGVCSAPGAPCRIGTLPALILLGVFAVISGAALAVIRDDQDPSTS